MRIRTQLRLVAIYSTGITAVSAGIVCFGFIRPVSGASKIAEFDRIRVHRIDVVEPDGTPRLFISDRAEFPGEFFHGREVERPDRNDSAGMLFVNDEGTEDGGLIYGGAATNGHPTSFGHLSFDQYDQDQTINIGTALADDGRTEGIALNDMPEKPITPDMAKEATRIKAMPNGPARAAAWAEFLKTFPAGTQRAALERSSDGSVALTLKDQQGRKRIELSVDPGGNPQIELLDEQGRVRRKMTLDQ